jgi:hypothetical protein
MTIPQPPLTSDECQVIAEIVDQFLSREIGFYEVKTMLAPEYMEHFMFMYDEMIENDYGQ